MKNFLFAVFMLSAYFSIAGTARIDGKIKDKLANEPLQYASVALYTFPDSKLITGVITNEIGHFEFKNLEAGNYFIKVMFVGYENKQTESFKLNKSQNLTLPDIFVSSSKVLVDEVIVTASELKTTNRLEKQTFKADQFESAKGGSASDVLKNMPSVSINGQGEISVRGSSGFLLLINGKPVLDDAQNMLSQISANSVENVEIISSPGAKYDPDGKAGIINITTKSGTSDQSGFIINLHQGLPSTTTYNNVRVPVRNGLDLNYTFQKKKWDISVGANYARNDMTGFRDGDVHIINHLRNTINRFPSVGERSFNRYYYSGRTSIVYTANKNNVFSFGIFSGKKYQERDADIFYENSQSVFSTNSPIYSFKYYNENKQIKQGSFTLGNIDYTHTFSNKSSLTISALYEYDDLYGNTFNKNLSAPGGKMLQYVENPYQKPLNGYRLKVDYSVNIGSGKLETGYQFRRDKQDGNFDYLISPVELNQPNLDQFRGTAISENTINSVYSQYSAKSEKLEYIAGLRYEYSKRTVELSIDPNIHNLELSNLFPSVNAIYNLSNGFKLKAGLSRRIERQSNNQLNPIPEREHSETLEIGDPDLKPELINLAEIGIIKNIEKGSIFSTLYYRGSKNPMQRVNSVYADTILARVYTNVEKASALGFEFGTNIQPVKWWNLYLGANIYNQKYQGDLIVFGKKVSIDPKNDWVYSINANTSFNLTNLIVLQANLNYLSARPTAQGEDSRFFSPNLSLKKNFFKNKMTASVQWQNIDLGMNESNMQRISTWGKDFYTTTNYIYETDVVLLNLSFNLNKTKTKAKLLQSEFGEKEF